MAIYAGESVRIYADLAGWNDSPLTPDDVTAVKVIISDPLGNRLVDGAGMAWDVSSARWLYRWDTPEEAGTYVVETIFFTPDGTSAEVRRVRLDSPRGVPSTQRVLRGPYVF